MCINEDGDLKYMEAVHEHNSDGGRWLRWMDAVCFPEYEPFVFEGSSWYLLEYDGKYVGYSGWRRLNSDVGELCRAGVLPEWRGNEFQRHMIRWRERNMKDNSIVISVTSAFAGNHHSINNLIACGYSATSGDEWTSAKKPDGAVFFRKKL